MNVKIRDGFTLLEVMLVVVILTMLAAVAVPRLYASSETAREKADIITGRELKSALDRYQIENGVYPCWGELQAEEGKVTGQGFIPEYISRLDSTVTQQAASAERKGFAIASIRPDGHYPDPVRIIMIYLDSDGSAAEVMVFDKDLVEVLWSSVTF